MIDYDKHTNNHCYDLKQVYYTEANTVSQWLSQNTFKIYKAT